jgi:hypothetical protein
MVAMRLDFYIYNYSRLLLCAGILLMPLSAQAANGSAVPATRI